MIPSDFASANAFSAALMVMMEVVDLWQLVDALTEEDFDEFFRVLGVFFANIPYEMHLKYEAYYQTILYLVLKQVGLKVQVEQQTNRGRIDTVVQLETRIIIFEFKLDGNAAALPVAGSISRAQIRLLSC